MTQGDPPQKPLNGTAEIAREVLAHVYQLEREVRANTGAINDHKIDTKDKVERIARFNRVVRKRVSSQSKEQKKTNEILSEMKYQQRLITTIGAGAFSIVTLFLGIWLKFHFDRNASEASEQREQIRQTLNRVESEAKEDHPP